jgi:hypothetical protein
LGAKLLVKRALQSAEAALLCLSFNRFHVSPLAAHRKGDTGWHRLAVNQDSARATLAAIAAGFRSSEVSYFAQIVDEQLPFEYCVFAPTPVELQFQQALFRLWARYVHSSTPKQKGCAFWRRPSMTKIKIAYHDFCNIN